MNLDPQGKALAVYRGHELTFSSILSASASPVRFSSRRCSGSLNLSGAGNVDDFHKYTILSQVSSRVNTVSSEGHAAPQADDLINEEGVTDRV